MPVFTELEGHDLAMAFVGNEARCDAVLSGGYRGRVACPLVFWAQLESLRYVAFPTQEKKAVSML